MLENFNTMNTEEAFVIST